MLFCAFKFLVVGKAKGVGLGSGTENFLLRVEYARLLLESIRLRQSCCDRVAETSGTSWEFEEGSSREPMRLINEIVVLCGHCN